MITDGKEIDLSKAIVTYNTTTQQYGLTFSSQISFFKTYRGHICGKVSN